MACCSLLDAHLILLLALFLSTFAVPITATDVPWGVARCFPTDLVSSTILQSDCDMAVQGFISDFPRSRLTFKKVLGARPQPNTINCPWSKSHGTCKLLFNMQENGLPESHEVAFLVGMASNVAKTCAKPGQLGGRTRVGNSLFLGMMQVMPSGRGGGGEGRRGSPGFLMDEEDRGNGTSFASLMDDSHVSGDDATGLVHGTS